jgi:hypothetical protein
MIQDPRVARLMSHARLHLGCVCLRGLPLRGSCRPVQHFISHPVLSCPVTLYAPLTSFYVAATNEVTVADGTVRGL